MACPCCFRYSGFCLWLFGIPVSTPCGCAEERRARRIRDRACLSEASLRETPSGPSTTGCPQRSGGTQQPGSPFGIRVTSLREVSESPLHDLCLLSFGEAKESELPPGNPRPANLRRESRRKSGKRGRRGRTSRHAHFYRINGNVRKYSASSWTGSFFLSAASKASRISSPVGLRLKQTCSDSCATGRGLNTTSPAPPRRDRV